MSILARTQEIFILTPPKVASQSLHETLCPPERWVDGPCPWSFNDIDKHSCYVPIPAERHNFSIALVVRHPLGRVLSFYNHQYHFIGEKLEFPKFLWERININNPWFWPCSNYKPHFKYKKSEEVNHIIKYENIIQDLSDLGFKNYDKLTSRENNFPHILEVEDLTQEQRNKIRDLYKDDLQYYE